MQRSLQSLSQDSAEPWVSSGQSPLPRRLGPGGAWAGRRGGRRAAALVLTGACGAALPPSGGSSSLCVLIWEAAEEEVTRPRVGETWGWWG